jgi:enoyl-CoA hydratase/carnithine racemase
MEAIKNQLNRSNSFRIRLEKGNELLNYIDTLNIPVMAAISGVCFGAGLEIALACDIRIAEENSLFAFPEVNHKLFPGLSGTIRLAELSGKSTALELVLQGDLINAEKAKELGIIDTIVSKKEAKEYAFTLAEKITNNRPLSVINAVMNSIHNFRQLSTDERIKSDIRMFVKLALENLNQKSD